MNKTYSEALDYILEKAAGKKQGKISGLSMDYGGFEKESGKSIVYNEETLQKHNIKGLVDEYIKREYKIGDHEISEMYNVLYENGYLLRENKNTELITITLKGLDWISSEMKGFVGERQRLIRKNRGRKWINTFLIVGALATTFIAFFEGVKLYKETKKGSASIEVNSKTQIQDTLKVRVIQTQKDTIPPRQPK